VFGTFDVDARGRRCYRPAQPSFPPLDDVWPALEECRRAVEAFDGALSTFAVPGVVGTLFARYDAVRSSHAEGTTTTFSDLLEFESVLRRAPDPEDAAIVAGCARAFDDLAANPAGDPAAAALAIHRRLFAGSRDPFHRQEAGAWKRLPNGIADRDEPAGFFLFTHPDRVPECMADWAAFAAEQGRPPLLRHVLAHWWFEHVHPLHDGNGRVGRLLIPLLIERAGATANSCAFCGEAVHEDKDAYVRAMVDARRTGDFTFWSRVMLTLIGRTAEANLRRLQRLDSVLADWRERTRGIRAHAVAHALVPWALLHPKFTVRDAVTATGRTPAAVNAAVRQLVERDIVVQAGDAGRDRLFVAPEVLALF